MRHGHHSQALHTINTRHPDQLLTIARALGGHPDATSALAEGIDADGLDLLVETPAGPATVRVSFAERVVDYPRRCPSRVRAARQSRSRPSGLNRPTERTHR